MIQKDGKIYKEDLRGVYDVRGLPPGWEHGRTELQLTRPLQGSIFWKIASERKQGKGWNQGFGLGGDGFVGATKVT